MKKFSITLFVILFTLSSYAQLSGNGFYRVQNAESKRYATIVDNKPPKDMSDVLSKGGNIDICAIITIEGFESVVSDPGSVIYIEGSDGKYILKGQGMDTYKLSGLYFGIHPSRTKEGTYWCSGKKSDAEKYLKEGPYNNGVFGFHNLATVDRSERGLSICNWNIIPITEDDDHYFGLKPEVEINGKYYTTLYASFAYKLSNGMRAYYVKQTDGKLAEIAELESGKVPGTTPVIIECNSNKASDNKITPLSETVTYSMKNVLNGNYFCNIIRWASDGEEETIFPNWNTTDYDANTMRLLGNVDGKLGFIKADIKYLPANKAYLTIPKSIGESFGSVELVDAETYAQQASGILNITENNKTNKDSYTLTGNKLHSIENLPAGVYIINGKKTIIRR